MTNVFGKPITDATLKAMEEYVNQANITSLDKARVALNMQTANTKDTQSRAYVEKLKQQWGTGVSTLCLIYNATGNTLTFTDFKDWYGHIGQAPYPMRIQNGQWGAFLHVKTSSAATGSCSAAVFRGKDGSGDDCDYMMAWSTPWGTTYGNSVWGEARSQDHFTDHWGVIRGYLDVTRYKHSDPWKGCLTTIGTGHGTSPTVEAIFTLEGAAE